MPLSRQPNDARTTGELYPAEHWMSARDAAAALGIARQTLYERALDGEIATVKVAGRRPFSRADVTKLAALAA